MSQNKQKQPSNGDAEHPESRGFAGELLRLCESAYELEASKKEEMEKKAQYYLAIVTGILGIIAFKGDILNLGSTANVGAILARRGWSVAVPLSLLLATLILSLFCIIMVLAPRKYDRPYPNQLSTFVFRAKFRFKTESELIHNRAEEFAWAVEINMENNFLKSKWLLRLSRSVLANMVTLAILLMVSAL